MSIPAIQAPEGGSTHPLVGNDDAAGDVDLFEYCGNGQHGELWFLGGDFSGTGEEIERTRSYLKIQKMRYRDILDYRIEADEEVLNNTILKLILQPLVENALYHGIKNKRNGGTIVVRAKHRSDEEILLEVEDDGIGFTPEALARVQAHMSEDSEEIRLEAGFGIGNVNQRIRLYYGRQYGLTIDSQYREGTRVALVIPAKSEEAIERKQTRIRRNRTMIMGTATSR